MPRVKIPSRGPAVIPDRLLPAWINPLSFSTRKTRVTQMHPVKTTVAFITRLAATSERGTRSHGFIMSS